MLRMQHFEHCQPEYNIQYSRDTLYSYKTLYNTCKLKASGYDQEMPQSHSRPTHGTVRKSYKTFTVTRHLKNNKSIATSSLFLVKMITKLERTHSNEYKHRTPSK